MRTFVLFDGDQTPFEIDGEIWMWNGYREADNRHSILNYCEEHSEKIKDKYCKWIDALADTKVNGATLAENLRFNDGFSYWWMTLIVEKSPWKSPVINDLIRLIALDDILSAYRPDKFIFISRDRKLNRVIRELCKQSGISYQWMRNGNYGNNNYPWRLLKNTLFPFQSILHLCRHIYYLIKFKRKNKQSWFSGKKSILFVSYFDNLDIVNAEKAGVYRSGYWNGLPDMLVKNGFKCNWLQLYVPGRDVSADISSINRLNETNFINESHCFLQSYLTWKIIASVFYKYCLLYYRGNVLKKVISTLCCGSGGLCFWPLLKNDWDRSFHGPAAIHNLFFMELFNAAINSMQKQEICLYLYENQSWEIALLNSWYNFQPGKIIAVPHSTRSFWDLRFYHTPDGTELTCTKLRPQVVAVNGDAAYSLFNKENYPSDMLARCEALRYIYLDTVNKQKSNNDPGNSTTVLVLGGYIPTETNRMLEILSEAIPALTGTVTLLVKPHPNNPIDIDKHPSLNLKLKEGNMENILKDVDVVLACSHTSAAVDAWLYGLPTIVIVSGDELNYSPLRGVKGVIFVETSSDLADIFDSNKYLSNREELTKNPDYFYINHNLSGWKRLLKI